MTTRLEVPSEPDHSPADQDQSRDRPDDLGPISNQQPTIAGHQPASHEAYRLHRPERLWPHPPGAAPIELTAPPTAPDEGMGRWATILPVVGSLSMVAFAFLARSLVYLVVIGLMVVGMVAAGLATSIGQRRRQDRRWKRTKARYHGHLDAVGTAAADAAGTQRDALEACFPDFDGLIEVAGSGRGLWERRPGDIDFGAVRLGRGQVRALRPVVVSRDEGPLVEAEQNLTAAAQALVAGSAVLSDAPVTIPLIRLGTIAVVADPDIGWALVGSWCASLATFHAPGELRLMGLVPLSAARCWDWTKWLPHTRDPDGGEGLGRVRRAITADPQVFATQLEAVLRPRLEQLRRSNESHTSDSASRVDNSVGRPIDGASESRTDHLVVVVDGYLPGTGPAALETLLAHASALGATVVVLVERAADVPATCGAVVEIDQHGVARYLESGPAGRVEVDVVVDQLEASGGDHLGRTLAPLALRAGEAGADLADPVRLVELLGVDEVDQLDFDSEWLSIDDMAHGAPAALLQIPIGRADDGSTLVLDLKEAAAGGMGPHGILVGATGSGKSELLRSLTAAVAARHDPSLVNLLLVDFKGGAAFADLAALPHVSGLVTNLADDMALVERVQLALSGELARRQEALRSAGNLDSLATYQARRAAGADLGAVPYLLVVVDEFGELLAAKPDFVDTFLAVARLGRSLGVHLLLATQRLDEGRIRGLEPHLRYRLCLRTYTSTESRAVLGSPAAFELPSIPGLGYLKVDSEQTRFKAALVATRRTSMPDKALPTPAARSRLSLIRPLSLAASAPAVNITRGAEHVESDLQALVVAALAGDPQPARPVWLDPLPDTLGIADLDLALGILPANSPRGYFAGTSELGNDRAVGARTGKVVLEAVLGLVDAPEEQAQGPLVYSPMGPGGNLGIAGAQRSGKSTLLQTLLLVLARDAGPERVQFYCIDLGGGGLFGLAALPQVGAVVGRGQAEATARLLRELRAVLDERATQRRNGAGSAGQELWPEIFLVIDNVGQLRQVDPDLETAVAEIATAGLPFGVHVVVAANRWLDVRPQLLDAIGTRLELHLADPTESLAGRQAAARIPASRPGRGITRTGHVFQVAMPSFCAPDDPLALQRAVGQIQAASGAGRAPAIVALPEQVFPSQVGSLSKAAGSPVVVAPPGAFLLGVEEFRSRAVYLELSARGGHVLVFGDRGSGRSTLLRRTVTHLSESNSAGNVRIHLVDPNRSLLDIADGPLVESYATTNNAAEKLAVALASELANRAPSEKATLAELRKGRWWSGPEHVLVVDDYDLTLSTMGGPLAALAELLGQSADLGFYVLLARRVAGSQRSAFETFGQRLKEVAATALVLSGSPEEGPLVAGVTARAMPPGRGTLVTEGGGRLIQCCVPEPRQDSI